MRLKLTIIGFLFGIIMATQIGCSKISENDSEVIKDKAISTNEKGILEDNELSTKEDPSGQEAVTETIANNDNVVEESGVKMVYDELISGTDVKLADVFTFIKENIGYVSMEYAADMLLQAEELQIKNKSMLEEKYYQEAIQLSFQEAVMGGNDFSEASKLEDTKLRDLLQETKDSGFKLEQAEGSFFPVIDYAIYKQFSEYATPDIKEYLNIMVVESEKAFAKDAALMISWNEVIDRALLQEAFINTFDTSVKAEAVRELYQRYERIAFYGLNNTPLFLYDTNKMDESARTAYEQSLDKVQESEFLKNMKSFMDLVKESNGKLNDEIEQFRNDLTSAQN